MGRQFADHDPKRMLRVHLTVPVREDEQAVGACDTTSEKLDSIQREEVVAGPEEDMRVVFPAGEELCDEGALPDARLAAQKHDPATRRVEIGQ